MSMMRIAAGLEVAADAMDRVQADLLAFPAAQQTTLSGRFGRLRQRMDDQVARQWQQCQDDAARLAGRMNELAASVRVSADAYASADEEGQGWTR